MYPFSLSFKVCYIIFLFNEDNFLCFIMYFFVRAASDLHQPVNIVILEWLGHTLNDDLDAFGQIRFLKVAIQKTVVLTMCMRGTLHIKLLLIKL